VNGSGDLYLGIIAVATATIAIVQIAVIVAAGLVARRIGRLADQVERDLKPIFAHLDAIGRDASRAAALAAAQVERADALMGEIATRVDHTFVALHAALTAPAREGRALFIGVKAGLDALRLIRENVRRRRRGDDEDALFI
jgi:hypothetical protein